MSDRLPDSFWDLTERLLADPERGLTFSRADVAASDTLRYNGAIALLARRDDWIWREQHPPQPSWRCRLRGHHWREVDAYPTELFPEEPDDEVFWERVYCCRWCGRARRGWTTMSRLGEFIGQYHFGAESQKEDDGSSIPV